MDALSISASFQNGIIYLSTSDGSSNGTVYALRAQDGSMLWDYPISGSINAAPILDSSTIYVSANNGMAYALQAGNGRIVWHYFIQVGG